jgi:hypothetical protein
VRSNYWIMDEKRLRTKSPRWLTLSSRVVTSEKAARRAAYLSQTPEIRLLEDAEVANRLIRERIAKKRSS